MIQLAVFASGAGSNARKIIEHFNTGASTLAQVSLVVCNKPGAGVLQVAADAGIPTLVIERERFLRGDGYVPELQAKGINFVVLAGFLWKVPTTLIDAYPRKIVNIHPALLPKWGGKGMYGAFVHQAVVAAAEKESGITIHYVDEHYDHGDTIFQASCPVDASDTPDSLAQKIHELEHEHYPRVIEQLLREQG
ncbi:formyltetrahydrofolate-dependent phosphoribosylglycinamide formyltransferase [Cnuella takakiae]|uniref:Phosphoribosylglycinamide formyltransferase n=1 Tax=Cnuella takakiae TaxID=1302690 RepID=A0A1M5FBA1_9BACT|nr:phosphoribosylglycinamide formyltransferase [Cnuella takakiae]OLY91043.1 phosphoribosylglycinamide formyltransferase [Cnuella takakiae]SHF88719.1 formyltetrahydrofolate-dependent phosphoribosylglycinamide formyltransferase [Cnuella takakiae]